MKQLIQEMDSGTIRLVDVPSPMLRAGGVLVRTRHSVISVGTERSTVELGRKSLVGKAMERPDQVRKVLDTVAREGVASAYHKVKTRLSELSPMGYSAAGVVEGVGAGVTGIESGDLVACAGGGYASHAERLWVPRNLVVRVPDGVGSEAAAFSTLGAIALQGVRQAEPRLGETVAVIGLGILGQLTVQLLAASGVRPIAIDLDPSRVALATEHGALGLVRSDDVEARVLDATDGIGADAVIITAATSSTDPIELAGALARERARVVVVGAVPINVPRSPYYEKELDVRLSRSYGPGRYDPTYEEGGHDYPVGYVRWTEQRNMQAFLELVASGRVALDRLITHRFEFEHAVSAYDVVTGDDAGSVLGVVLEYPHAEGAAGAEGAEGARREAGRIYLSGGSGRGSRAGARARAGDERVAGLARARARARVGRAGVGLIGAGSFAQGVLVPALRKLDVSLLGVSSAGGVSARKAAEEHGFSYLASSPEEILADPETDAVIIATRHGDHARLAAESLRAGKAVFVEKPLALTHAELDDVMAAAAGGPALMVGFNRRFAPATVFLRERLGGLPGAKVVHVRANAGYIPPDSWVHDPVEGGGRLLGEGCHFIDLALFLAGSPAVRVETVALAGDDPAAALQDNFVVTMQCADGSVASVLYTAKGSPRSGKERVEMFAGGRSALIDDFRLAEVQGRKRERWKGKQDKGHHAELTAFVAAVRHGGTSPIPLEELEHSSRVTILALESLRAGQGIKHQ
jgi:predicted dehydrogenase/threonine dehydrogenase-like Zn-dependent dehydrogenase